VNVQTLLAEYGSPAYVYDLDQVRVAYAALRRALPVASTLYYSLKANPHPALVGELRRLGCQAEVSSTGELQTALDCGYQPERCLYTGPGKTLYEIRYAFERGATYFSIDSPTDLRKVALVAEQMNRPARVLLRINPSEAVPGLGLTMTGGPSQFGADADWVRHAPQDFASTAWAQVIGFHIYMGTNITTTATLLQTFAVASRLAVELADVLGIDLQIVDLGGGFGHPFATTGERCDFSALREPLESLLDDRFPGWRSGTPHVAFETGRYLVASSGTLFCTVQDVKESQGRPFVVLDSGIHHLGGMAGLRRVPRIGAELMCADRPAAETTLHNAHVVGPLCTPLDHLAQGVDLPSLSPGTILAVRNVGAYGLTGSLLGFLSRDAPVEIVLDGEHVKEASQILLVRCAR
jgi:diaminopimelate decarboxylase